MSDGSSERHDDLLVPDGASHHNTIIEPYPHGLEAPVVVAVAVVVVVVIVVVVVVVAVPEGQ